MLKITNAVRTRLGTSRIAPNEKFKFSNELLFIITMKLIILSIIILFDYGNCCAYSFGVITLTCQQVN